MRTWISCVTVMLILLTLLIVPPASVGQSTCQLNVPTIKLGVQGIASGAHADYGRQINMGATLAIEEINASGGILGCKLEMRFMDDENKPATGVKNARFLVNEWGAHFLYGTDSSGIAMALGPVLQELKRIQFFTHAATHRLTEELVYDKKIKEIVRVSAPVYQDAIAAWVFKDNPEIKRWATIGADYEYGYATWAIFKDVMKKSRPDAEFVGAAWAPFLTLDFSSQISAVMATNPDAIIATPWAGEAVTLLRQALLMGVFDKVQAWFQAMGGSVDVLEGISREVQDNRFNGKLWATARYIHNWPDNGTNRSFVERFQKRWSRLPNYSAETTYSAIYITKLALEKGKSLETDSVLAALTGMRILTPAGLRVYRAEDHQFVYNVPAGRVVWNAKYPIPVLGDLVVIPANEYWRSPPFTPVPVGK